jgi:predicted glycoside hydrolase/deacetylase ChbG (UPF0249 family)
MPARLPLRRLVLNADDAGIDVPRNDGILEAYSRGVLTSATLLATGPACEDFVRRARSVPRPAGGRELGIGVHLNLSECCPPASVHGVPGAFVAKHELWERAARGALDPRLVEAELAAQLQRVLDLGLHPTHVDGHNHVHSFPCVAVALERLAARFPFVASRRRSVEFTGVPGPSEKGARFAALTAEWQTEGVLGPVCFAGFCLEGRCSVERLLAVLETCPAESLEVMLHPGRCAHDSLPFSAELEREVELDVLLDPRLREWLASHDVELVHYGAFSEA